MASLHRCLFAALFVVGASPAVASTNLTGNYLLKLSGHLDVKNYKICAAVTENGSTLGFANSGTVTITLPNGQTVPGVWFTQNFGATFVFQRDYTSLVLSGVLGSSQIKYTTWMETRNGKPIAAGTFTALKGGC